MTELPKGWALATVDELSLPGGVTDGPFGSNLKTEHYTAAGPRVVRLQNIGDGRFVDERAHIDEAHFERLRKHEVVAGDVLVASLGELLPRACLAPATLGPAIVKADCIRVRPHPELSTAYLMWALNSPDVRAAVGASIKGVGRPRVNLGDLRQLKLPVAPPAEQERIVMAIEEAFSKLDAGEAGLRTVRQLLKRMRAAILTAAVTGRLVPHDPTDTPAAKLLADLGADCIAEPEGEVVPDGWSWALLGSVAAIGGGIQKQPNRNPVRNRAPFLRVANVGRGKLDLSDVHEIEVFDGELDRYGLVAGDLLVVEGNGSPDQIGRSALWHGEITPCVHQNHLIRVRPGLALEPSYLELYWNSPAAAQRVQSVASSTSGLHTLSTGKLKILPVVVPPLEEQKRIVTEVERQLSFVEACERAVDVGLVRSAGLRRSVLKAAFEGRLVPQDPSDEAASVLLDRIRAERAAQPVAKRRARQTA
jgi:type I restriction enzyme, S subunit